MNPTDSLFWPYLSPILEDLKVKKGVVYAQMSDGNGMDRMIEDSVSEVVYPGVFVFRPKWALKLVENHIHTTNFNTQLYVWCKGKLDNRDYQDEAYAQAESIVSSLIEKLQHDARRYSNFFEFDSVTAEPVVYLGADAACGYEVKFKLGIASNEIFC